MGTVVIRPDAYRDSSGISVTSGGIHTVLADSSDATYAWSSAGATAAFTLSYANPTLPAGAVVTRVVLSARLGIPSGTGLYALRLYDGYPGGKFTVPAYAQPVTAGVGTRNLTLAKAGDGSPWTAAKLNNLWITFFLNSNVRAYDTWITVTYNEQPVTAVTAPAGNYTTSVRPTIAWTYTDPEGDLQDRYWAKIFTTATATAAGFNPETTFATWSSGTQVSNANQTDVPVNLVNGTSYRAYVKTTDVGSGGRWSAWAYSTFTILVSVPDIPTLTVTSVDETNAAVHLAVSDGTTGWFATVERSDDGGTSWVPVRNADPLTLAGTTPVVDFETPPNQPVSYRASQFRVDAFDNVFASATSTPIAVTMPNALLRLKDPLNPAANIVISQTENIKIDAEQPTGVFAPLGRRTSIVLKGTTGGAKSSLSLQFKTQADWEAFDALRDTGNTLLLQLDDRQSWYVRLGPDRPVELLMSVERAYRPYRTCAVDWYEVDRPA